MYTNFLFFKVNNTALYTRINKKQSSAIGVESSATEDEDEEEDPYSLPDDTGGQLFFVDEPSRDQSRIAPTEPTSRAHGNLFSFCSILG